MRRRGAAAGTASNGKSASCRARLRALRNNPNPGRRLSETPSRMERSHTPREVAKPHLIEARSPDHFAKLALPRKTPNAFHEVAIGLRFSGDDAPEQRHDPEAVEIVKRLEERRNFRGELETQKPAAGFEHAPRFGECVIDPGDVPQAKGDRVEIDAAVGHWKPFGIGADPFDAGEDAFVERPGASDFEHLLAGVARATTGRAPVRYSVERCPSCPRSRPSGAVWR